MHAIATRGRHAATARDVQQLREAEAVSARYDEAAERQVLGSVLLDPDALAIAAQHIASPRDFGDPRHSAVWQAILAIDARHEPIDSLTVRAELIARQTFGIVGQDVINDLTDSVTTTAHLERHAAIVADHSRVRALAMVGQAIVAKGSDPATRASDFAEFAAKAVHDASCIESNGAPVPLEQVIHDIFDSFEHRAAMHVIGVPSGLRDLDKLTRGMHRGQLIIVAARPGIGKSALAGNVTGTAAKSGHVLFFSLEMCRDEIGGRMLAEASGIDGTRISGGQLTQSEMTAVIGAAQNLVQLPIAIDDAPGQSLAKLRAKALTAHRRNALALVVVDYLQLVKMPGIDDRRLEVDAVARGLKELAKELSCPVLALAQLNRNVDSRGKDARPRLSDLKESGEIEQSADVVIFIHRDEDLRSEGAAELIVAKQRNGPTDTVRVRYASALTRFFDMEDSSSHGRYSEGDR